MRTKLLIVLSVSLCACSDNDAGPGAVDVPAFEGEPPISSPWLREQMPVGALSYLRIPHPLGLIGMPKGNLFDIALGSESNMQNLLRVQQGLAENLADDAPMFAEPIPRILLDHLRSPIEVVGMAVPGPSALIGMTLDLESRAEVDELFAELAAVPPFFGLLAPLDDAGFGQIRVDMPVFVHFDEETGRLAIYGGLMASQATFAGLLEPPAETGAAAMFPVEQQIDDSGQGLFAWVDAAQALTMGGMFLPPDVAQMLAVTGLNQLRGVALGMGIADGKGRLKVLLDVGDGNANRLLPVLSNEVTATSVGEPRGMLLLSLPSAAEFSRLEQLLISRASPDEAAEWQQAKGELNELIGTSIEELLTALGPELVTFSDQAGNFLGLKVRDQALLDGLLDRLASGTAVALEERVVDGQTIRYIDAPNAFELATSDQADDLPPPAVLLGRTRNRIYWVEEEGYLYIAGVPQLLMDRARLGADTSIGDWLNETQRFDVSSSFLAATGSFPGLPRMTYQTYLGMMQGLADLVEVDYDIWSMPTASQLGLPDRGMVGLSLNFGEPYVSLELAYESHPAEFLFGSGGMAAVAMAGIAAAVALPAYQDYTIRAQVSEGLNLAAGIRAAVEEAYANTGSIPVDRAGAGLTPAPTDTAGLYVAGINVLGGEVTIRFGNAAQAAIANQTLILTPYASGDRIVWACGHAAPPAGLTPLGQAERQTTTVAPQYLPSGCR